LRNRRQQLTDHLQARIARIRQTGPEAVTEQGEDEIDTAELEAALLDITATTLRRIDHALERLEEGRYGLCTECGDPISEARLKALPFADRCRDCESDREHRSASARLPERGGWRRTLAEESTVHGER
jgi:DnaK suppressor protein